jgi:hypothetical protein
VSWFVGVIVAFIAYALLKKERLLNQPERKKPQGRCDEISKRLFKRELFIKIICIHTRSSLCLLI